jgi:hypothetical protein
MKVSCDINGAAKAAMLGGAIGALAIAAFVLLHEAGFYSAPAHAASAQARQVPAIPPSLAAEHEEIHGRLVKATAVPGAIGAAARELEAVLGPHFTRENQIALPPLGLLAPLAAGQKPAGTGEVLAMTDALRKELPAMLEEHTRIRAATEKLHTVAVQQNAPEIQRFAEALAAHALMEEEVLYPAAILVGDIIRARR